MPYDRHTSFGVIFDPFLVFLPERGTATADKIFGGSLILCMIIGIPSNLLSFCFFSKQANKKTIHDKLYTLASATDICTLITAFAPISVLISDTGRSETVFKDEAICKSWTVIFYFVTRFSLFVVLIISMLRTVSIKSPLYKIKTQHVTWAFVTYAVWLLVKDTFFISVGALVIGEYDVKWACCIFKYHETLLGKGFVICAFIEIVAMTLTILLNFLTCVKFLIRRPSLNSGDALKFRTVSVTIAMFTAVCLVCTIPVSVVMVTQLVRDVISPYALFVPYVYMIVLNAALNPCVYMARLPAYGRWARILPLRFYRWCRRFEEVTQDCPASQALNVCEMIHSQSH